MRPSRISALPDLPRDAILLVRGPYRILRHPMYAGLVYLTLPPVLCPGPLWRLGLVALLVAVLAGKMAIEEAQLARTFPDYEDQARSIRRWIPWVW